jgi:mannose-6-phosphate isomerase-like protein (cupin superfamily)
MTAGFRTFTVADVPAQQLGLGRGSYQQIADPATGTANVDVHLNTLNVDSGPGQYHYHARSENIYVVLSGVVRVVVEGECHTLRAGDAASIAPGLRHAIGTVGDVPAALIEIYAPPGPDFHEVDDEDAQQALRNWHEAS